MKSSYRERDYTFGQAMLTLRTAIGLTQAGLAKYLGISRRAVGEWEAGSSYPKVEHLRNMITLGVSQQAFTAEHEAEEIRALWKAARQKVLLDERWLSTLLDQGHSHHLHLVPPHVEEASSSTPVFEHLASGTRVDWGDALAVPAFYGREGEQAQLLQWIGEERCHVVSVLGMGGIGKSALSVSLMYQVAEQFEVVIFRSLRNTPLLETLLDECLQVLSPEAIETVPATLEQRISLLLDSLRQTRVLVVLDNLESILQEEDVRGQLRPGFEAYGQVLRQAAETVHQSCLLLTSREQPAALRGLSGKRSPVRTLRLGALDPSACQQLLEEKELVGTEVEQELLIEVYGGNPLALKIAGETKRPP